MWRSITTKARVATKERAEKAEDKVDEEDDEHKEEEGKNILDKHE